MARDEIVPAGKEGWPAPNPWPALAAGLGAVFLSLVWFWVAGSSLTPVRVLLMVAGLVSVGLAVAIRFGAGGGWERALVPHPAVVARLPPVPRVDAPE